MIMKKITTILAVLALAVLIVNPTNGYAEKTENCTSLSTNAIVGKFSAFNIPFPDDTKFNIVDNTLHFDLPSSHYNCRDRRIWAVS